MRDFPFRQTQKAAQRVGDLLQGAVGAEPATKEPTAPNDQGAQHHPPDQKAERVVEQKLEAGARKGGLHDPGDGDDGKLPLSPPADEHGHEGQYRETRGPETRCRGKTGKRPGQDQHQKCEEQAQHGKVHQPGQAALDPDGQGFRHFGPREKPLGHGLNGREVVLSDFWPEDAVLADRTDQQFPIPGRVEAQPAVRAQHDTMLEIGHVVGGLDIDIRVAKGHGKPVLLGEQKVRRGVRHELFRHKRVAAIGQQKDRLVMGRDRHEVVA